MITETLAVDIISWCWIIFCLVWLFAWGWSKPTSVRKSSTRRILYLATLLVGVLLIWNGGSLFNYSPFNILIFNSNLKTLLIADVFAIVGVIVAVWARFTLGSNWSGSVQIKKDHQLITTGPYRFVRHPIYSGVLSLALAQVLSIANVASVMALIILTISFYIKLKLEEEYMLSQFPNEYPAYMKRTRRIIPLLF
jgi:protein-S-isoprenylcysteine O-methyltransferase Ste14